VHECLKQLLMSLLRAYRFSPIIPDLGLQVSCPSESQESVISQLLLCPLVQRYTMFWILQFLDSEIGVL